MEALIAGALSSKPARKRLALDAAATARIVVTFSRGLAVMERVHRDPERLRRSAAALIDALVRPANFEADPG
jgi:TetR/AcrR family transcriptional regulator, transcriptional repressor for nem operon